MCTGLGVQLCKQLAAFLSGHLVGVLFHRTVAANLRGQAGEVAGRVRVVRVQVFQQKKHIRLVLPNDLAFQPAVGGVAERVQRGDRKSTRLNSSHVRISYAVFCLKKKKKKTLTQSDFTHKASTWPSRQRVSSR